MNEYCGWGSTEHDPKDNPKVHGLQVQNRYEWRILHFEQNKAKWKRGRTSGCRCRKHSKNRKPEKIKWETVQRAKHHGKLSKQS